MRQPRDLDCPTIIRRKLDDPSLDLIERARFIALRIEYVIRATVRELIWR